jgi:hypothetical protein
MRRSDNAALHDSGDRSGSPADVRGPSLRHEAVDYHDSEEEDELKGAASRGDPLALHIVVRRSVHLGGNFELYIAREATVADLKRLICEKQSLSAEKQALQLEGMEGELDDTDVLGEYCEDGGSTLRVICRFKWVSPADRDDDEPMAS